jgi:hypothetical protein
MGVFFDCSLIYSTSPYCHRALWIVARHLLGEESSMLGPDRCEDSLDICDSLYLYESRSVFLHPRKSMEILDEVFTSLHHTLAIFPLPEELSMDTHRTQDLTECWLISTRDEAPGVSEGCSPNHESI